MVQLPKQEKSFWQEYKLSGKYAPLDRDLEADTVIVGAGIMN
jgi:hypothetical protein